MVVIYNKLLIIKISIFLIIYRQRKPFSEEEILHNFVQLLLAMKHIHTKNILHRDLKPQVFDIYLLECIFNKFWCGKIR